MSDSPSADLPAPTRHASKPRQKVPPFARYKGTSAWRKDRRRVRAYALFRAAEARTMKAATPGK